MTHASFFDETQAMRALVTSDLEQALAAHNKSEVLHEAMSYSLLNGGKRLRASLCMMTCEAFGGKKQDAIAAASALECIHAYSLIHDDLPAMDDDDIRRGKASNHKVFGEAMAILAGDGLQSLAFLRISESYSPLLAHKLCHLLSSASLKMAAGQSLDISSESFNEEAELENMHRLKTGALIRAAVLMGAACAGLDQSDEKWEQIDLYAKNIGLAFQVSDDILDATASTEELGKTAGKDKEDNKTTYVTLLGLKEAQKKADELIDSAIESLESFSDDFTPLRALSFYIRDRKH